MPELALQEEVAQDATAIYGVKFTLDDSPSGYPYIGAWRLHRKAQPVTKFKVGISPTVNQEDREATVNGWTENEDPFTQANLLDSEDNKVQQLISQIRISTSITNNARLVNRLITLFYDAKEEDLSLIHI